MPRNPILTISTSHVGQAHLQMKALNFFSTYATAYICIITFTQKGGGISFRISSLNNYDFQTDNPQEEKLAKKKTNIKPHIRVGMFMFNLYGCDEKLK